MNEYLQLIILGVVQGITEFLPVSSDGHLVVAKQVLGHTFGAGLSAGKDLEVMLHLGTLMAIVLVYLRDLWDLRRNPRLCGLIVLATVPAAVVGLTLEDWFDEMFSSPLAAGVGFLVSAAMLMVGHMLDRGNLTEKTLPWPAMILIGCFQALALLPGVSRSGSTIAGGLLTGMDRISATRFSFVLAVPVTTGAIALTVRHLLKGDHPALPVGPTIVGIVVSFVVGWLVLKGMIRLVQQRRLPWFAAYCVAIGLVTIAVSLNPLTATPAATAQASDAVAER